MRIVFFTHSLRSDWNNASAHFLRGIVTELGARGHDVRALEPLHGWSAANLRRDHGPAALLAYRRNYPRVHAYCYDPVKLDLDAILTGADVVVVHELSPPALVRAIGQHRVSAGRYLLLFHDAHHVVPQDLSAYDAVLVSGELVREIALREKMARATFVWHEAADTRVFYPRAPGRPLGDVVWIGNGEDGDSGELNEFLIEPVRELGLSACVYGARLHRSILKALADAGIRHGGYVPNHRIPDVFALFRTTVHIPRHSTAQRLPGVPGVRPFEALACGIPLISGPWHDVEGLFTVGHDLLMARDGKDMARQLRRILAQPEVAWAIARNGRETIRARHTCVRRADEFLRICNALRPGVRGARSGATRDQEARP